MAPMEPLSASPIKKKLRPIVVEKSYFWQTLSEAEWADLAEIGFPTKFRRLLNKTGLKFSINFISKHFFDRNSNLE